jgi:hypothetical protein
MSDSRDALLRTVLLAAGIALAGFLAGHGLVRARQVDRFVTVRGLAEQEVRADLALWPLRLSAAANDVVSAQATVRQNLRAVRTFLARFGIDSTQMELQELQVTDAFANPYTQPSQIANRYVVQQTLMVRTTQLDQVIAASQATGDLVSAGVVVTSGQEYGASGPTYLFTRLNDLKPEMIREATAQARAAAEQFAQDSRSRLGGIRQASQGVFQILARDQAPGINEANQPAKIVRIVSTVEFYLRD